MNENLILWITEELNQRGWSIRELAKRSGISHTTISNVLSRTRNPGHEFCMAIARGFNIPAEEVFRKAGMIPLVSQQSERQELESYLNILSPEDINTILRLAKSLANESKRAASKEA